MLKILIAVFLVGSLISFVLYGLDKAKAKKKAWRVPEKVLLLWGFLCGSVGALIAMQLFRFGQFLRCMVQRVGQIVDFGVGMAVEFDPVFALCQTGRLIFQGNQR